MQPMTTIHNANEQQKLAAHFGYTVWAVSPDRNTVACQCQPCSRTESA